MIDSLRPYYIIPLVALFMNCFVLSAQQTITEQLKSGTDCDVVNIRGLEMATTYMKRRDFDSLLLMTENWEMLCRGNEVTAKLKFICSLVDSIPEDYVVSEDSLLFESAFGDYYFWRTPWVEYKLNFGLNALFPESQKFYFTDGREYGIHYLFQSEFKQIVDSLIDANQTNSYNSQILRLLVNRDSPMPKDVRKLFRNDTTAIGSFYFDKRALHFNNPIGYIGAKGTSRLGFGNLRALSPIYTFEFLTGWGGHKRSIIEWVLGVGGGKCNTSLVYSKGDSTFVADEYFSTYSKITRKQHLAHSLNERVHHFLNIGVGYEAIELYEYKAEKITNKISNKVSVGAILPEIGYTIRYCPILSMLVDVGVSYEPRLFGSVKRVNLNGNIFNFSVSAAWVFGRVPISKYGLI